MDKHESFMRELRGFTSKLENLTEYVKTLNEKLLAKHRTIAMKDLNVRVCATPQEKEAAKQFRQKHFFDGRSIQDPHVWTFNREGHSHFAIYKKE